MLKKLLVVFSLFTFTFVLASCDSYVEVEYIDIHCNPSEVNVGDTFMVHVEVFPWDADNNGYDLSVSDSFIADMYGPDQFMAYNEGIVYINVQSHDNGQQNYCMVYVHPAPQ